MCETPAMRARVPSDQSALCIRCFSTKIHALDDKQTIAPSKRQFEFGAPASSPTHLSTSRSITRRRRVKVKRAPGSGRRISAQQRQPLIVRILSDFAETARYDDQASLTAHVSQLRTFFSPESRGGPRLLTISSDEDATGNNRENDRTRKQRQERAA